MSSTVKGEFRDEENPFGYDARGTNYFDMKRSRFIGNQELVLFTDGDALTIRATDFGVRVLLISGMPLGEPVAWYGPIVMNTRDELRTAFDDLERGTFIK